MATWSDKAAILRDPAVRHWVKSAILALDGKDPVDACDDAELVAELFRDKVRIILDGEAHYRNEGRG